MKPTGFEGINTVYAKDQKEYQPLPAMKVDGREGIVVTCWKMSFRERLRVIFTGKVWLSCMTFNQPLQPVKLATTKKEAK